MYRVLYYKTEDEAKLIQRMMVWQGFGCTRREDINILEETDGKPMALLYRHRTLVAKGFFAAAVHLSEQEEVTSKTMPGNKKAKYKPPPPLIKPRLKPKPKGSPVVKVTKPADAFDIKEDFNINF